MYNIVCQFEMDDTLIAFGGFNLFTMYYIGHVARMCWNARWC